MISGCFSPVNLDRIVADLGGWECVADSREGVLIDSLLFYSGDSVIGLMEQCRNPNESIYRVEIATVGTPEGNKIERYFSMIYTLD